MTPTSEQAQVRECFLQRPKWNKPALSRCVHAAHSVDRLKMTKPPQSSNAEPIRGFLLVEVVMTIRMGHWGPLPMALDAGHGGTTFEMSVLPTPGFTTVVLEEHRGNAGLSVRQNLAHVMEAVLGSQAVKGKTCLFVLKWESAAVADVLLSRARTEMTNQMVIDTGVGWELRKLPGFSAWLEGALQQVPDDGRWFRNFRAQRVEHRPKAVRVGRARSRVPHREADADLDAADM
jgi:hypothetical protein